MPCLGGRTCPNPPVELAIRIVAFAVRSMASRQASAGGHFSLRSVKTDVAARTVKSTSSMVYNRQSKPTVLPLKKGNLLDGSARSENARLRTDMICPP